MKTERGIGYSVSDVRNTVKKTLPKLVYIFGISFFFASASIVAQTPTPSPVPERQNKEVDLVHFGDLIDVDFLGSFEFDWRGTLTPEGYLDGFQSFDEPVFGLCRSESDIAADVARAYRKILREPKVVVRVLDRSNRAVVRLDGAVKFAQRFQIKRPVSLRELLVIAGGITDEASGDIAIFRPRNLSCGERSSDPADSPEKIDSTAPGNRSETLNIAIRELLSGNAAANPFILSGDIITVTRAVPIYVIGAVNNPRQVYSRSEITVTRAIATAGGLAKEAIREKISIFRREGDKTSIIEVDLEKIESGESNDVILKPFDIIEVPRKGGEKRKYPPVVGSGDPRGRGPVNPPLRIID